MADHKPDDELRMASHTIKSATIEDFIPVQGYNLKPYSDLMPKKAKRQPFNADEIRTEDITDTNSRPKDAIFDWTVCMATVYDNLSIAIHNKIPIGDDEDANTITRPQEDNKPIPGEDLLPQEDAKYQSDDQYHRPDACVYPRQEKKIGNYSNRDCVKLSKPEFVHRLTNIIQNKYKNI
jgi:hypothetical protein